MNSTEQPENRQNRIEAIAEVYRLCISAGEDCGTARFTAHHEDLMPELGEALKQMRLIEGARSQSRHDSLGSTTCTVGPEKKGSIAREGTDSVIPDHELIHMIGRGGFGEVWLCRNRLDDQYYAAKLFSKLNAIELEGVREYRQHAENNPYLIPIWTVGETQSCYFYIMPRADDAASHWKPGFLSL